MDINNYCRADIGSPAELCKFLPSQEVFKSWDTSSPTFRTSLDGDGPVQILLLNVVDLMMWKDYAMTTCLF